MRDDRDNLITVGKRVAVWEYAENGGAVLGKVVSITADDERATVQLDCGGTVEVTSDQLTAIKSAQ